MAQRQTIDRGSYRLSAEVGDLIGSYNEATISKKPSHHAQSGY